MLNFQLYFICWQKMPFRGDKPKHTHVLLYQFHWELFTLKSCGGADWIILVVSLILAINHEWVNIRMRVWVCMCLGASVCAYAWCPWRGSLGLCRSEQVTPGWGKRMEKKTKKTLKESDGLIWTALLCSGTLTRLLSDESKTHSTVSSLVWSTDNWLKHSGLSLLLQLLQLQEWIIVWLLKTWFCEDFLLPSHDLLLYMRRIHLRRPLSSPAQCERKKRVHTLFNMCFSFWPMTPAAPK